MSLWSAIPPVLAPVDIQTLWRAVRDKRSLDEIRSETERAVRETVGEGACFFYESGRAAMVDVLRVMHRLSGRSEVVVPGYTCFSVPAAVVAAGLRVVPCDLRERDLALSPESLAAVMGRNTLALIPTHLYGVPCPFGEVLSMARKEGVFVLEDAAQGLGGSCEGIPMGAGADAGLFSLSRGKNLTTGHGGFLLVQNPALAEELFRNQKNQFKGIGRSKWGGLIEMAGLKILSGPPFFGLLRAIPKLEIGISRFDPKIEVHPMDRFGLSVLMRVLGSSSEVTRLRRENTRRILALLSEFSELRPLSILSEKPEILEEGAWLRFPAMASCRTRQRLIEGRGRDLGLSGSYPRAVPDIPGLEDSLEIRVDFPVARKIAGEIVTIPTHHRLPRSYFRGLLDCLRSLS